MEAAQGLSGCEVKEREGDVKGKQEAVANCSSAAGSKAPAAATPGLDSALGEDTPAKEVETENWMPPWRDGGDAFIVWHVQRVVELSALGQYLDGSQKAQLVDDVKALLAVLSYEVFARRVSRLGGLHVVRLREMQDLKDKTVPLSEQEASKVLHCNYNSVAYEWLVGSGVTGDISAVKTGKAKEKGLTHIAFGPLLAEWKARLKCGLNVHYIGKMMQQTSRLLAACDTFLASINSKSTSNPARREAMTDILRKVGSLFELCLKLGNGGSLRLSQYLQVVVSLSLAYDLRDNVLEGAHTTTVVQDNDKMTVRVTYGKWNFGNYWHYIRNSIAHHQVVMTKNELAMELNLRAQLQARERTVNVGGKVVVFNRTPSGEVDFVCVASFQQLTKHLRTAFTELCDRLAALRVES